MRLISTLSILLLCLGSIGLGQETKLVSQDKEQLSANRQRDSAIRERLMQSIDLELDEMPWSDVESFLEKKLDCNIVLTHSAVDDSLGPNEPISCSLKGLKASAALRIMLLPKNATYLVQDNVIKIISLDDAEDVQYFTNHFVNVRSLLAIISELESNRIGTPCNVSEKPAGGAMPGGGGGASEKPMPTGVTTAESMLIDLIQTSVNPDQWKQTGNGLATLKIIGGYVVVNSDTALADSLDNFLEELSYHLSRD